MSNIGYEIERLLKFALKKEMISKWDVIPTRNALIDLLKIEEPFEGEVDENIEESAVKILENILDYAVIPYVDVLVDGEFQMEKKDVTLLWKGSSNQRVIDVKKTKEKGEIVLLEVDN